MGGSSSKLNNQINHALNPNLNGISSAFTKTIPHAFTSTIPHALQPVTNVVTKVIPNAITKQLPAVAVTAGAVLGQNLNPATNHVAASFAQIPAALNSVPVINQLPITQLLTGNTSGFVNSLQNEFSMGVNTLGLGGVVGQIPGLSFVNPTLPPLQPVYGGNGPIYVPNPTNGGPGNGATSSGSDQGSYAQPGAVTTSSSTAPNYTELLIIGGVISALVILR